MHDLAKRTSAVVSRTLKFSEICISHVALIFRTADPVPLLYSPNSLVLFCTDTASVLHHQEKARRVAAMMSTPCGGEEQYALVECLHARLSCADVSGLENLCSGRLLLFVQRSAPRRTISCKWPAQFSFKPSNGRVTRAKQNIFPVSAHANE